MRVEEERQEGFPVSVDGWFSSGWYTFRKHGGLLVRGVAIMVAFSILVAVLGYLPGGEIIGIIMQLTVGLVLTAGWLNFCLRLVREEDPVPMDILRPFGEFTRVWLPAMALTLVVFTGSLLLIIPGFYLTVRLGMGMFTVIDKRTDVAGSMKASWRITSGHEGKLIVYYLIMIGLVGITIFPTLVGKVVLGGVASILFNFLIAPLMGVTYASAYDSLLFLGEHRDREKNDPVSPE
ncbi:MAG TPA: hypothetical protein VLA34_04180 [Candidatus Krumholzibacterium sp.]|nr:hypothetical protein [Candidatus Krumholzibacterium sp.]